MKLTIEPHLEQAAQDFSDAVIDKLHSGNSMAPQGWTYQAGMDNNFAQDPAILEAFTMATKYLQATDFARHILEEWRDERSAYKEDDPSYTMADFMEDLGYLEGFTGRNLTQLVKYYLSPRAIVDGAWLHVATWTSQDSLHIAHSFVPLSFREYDGFLWYQEIQSGRGMVTGHNEL